MPTLRVVLAAAPSPARDDAWALFDAGERRVRSGVGPPASWPDADRREAVLAASVVRLAGVVLPPMPADRVAAAAAYALEDQLAGPAQEQHLAASARRRDGGVDVAIVQRALLPPLRRAFARVVAEPATAPLPPAGAWRWHASAAGGGFVRKPDGSAFAVADPGREAPAELVLALRQASRAGTIPGRVEATFDCTDAQLAAWSAQCGTAFARGAAWRWDSDGAAIAAAPNLLQGEFAPPGERPRPRGARAFRLAATLAVVAVALHVGATATQWAWLSFESWQIARAIVATARDAGAGEHPDAATAAAALARAFADARHRAGLAAPSDATPLLARAAPALAALPAGALKSATYTPGAWTLDLAKLDEGALAALDRGFANAGLASLQATTPAGTRVRATLAPGTDRP